MTRQCIVDFLPAQVTALVGANGAGKSTLLHEVARQQNSQYCAMYQQESPLNFALTVQEYVALGRLPWRGVARLQHNADAVTWALARCGMTELQHRSVLALSGGERAKVRLARSLAQLWQPQDMMNVCPQNAQIDLNKTQTKYWLLDEADAHLDVRQKHFLGELCRAQARAGWTVGIVSHDLAWVRAYCDQVCAVRALNIVEMGETMHILANIPPDSDFWR